ncbi:MAG: hypothetical protein NTU83_06575 [Candidatus Hydrogenedentes bacterium]|nr:hypothetical protein [Candidatus Hydrogenedentota bacterium]
MKTSVRLQFEQGVLRPVYQTEQMPSRVFPRLALLAGLAVLVALAVGATHFLRTPVRASDAEPIIRMAAGVASDAEPIIRMAAGVLDALKTNSLSGPLVVCAESEAGAALLREEDKRLFKSRKPARDSRRACMESLRAIREALAGDGLAWEQVHPLAFGGVEAKVLDTPAMNDAARSLTGAIYFAAGDRVYGLELTARRCGNQYVVVDVWNCVPVDAKPTGLETFVDGRYRAFREEPAKSGEAAIKSARRMFVALS